MTNRPENLSFSTTSLRAQIATMEVAIANKDSVIAERESVIEKRDSVISKLTCDLEAARFQNEQMRRMIFGSKRERFVPVIDINQLRIDFEPSSAEIAQEVKAERELIRIAYQRRKVKKAHPGRMVLPSHLPVVEIVIEPSEDTTHMVCIGREVTDELDYTPAGFISTVISAQSTSPRRMKSVSNRRLLAHLTARSISVLQVRPF